MLQSDFFGNETEALIDLNVIYGAGKRITDKCLIIFSKEIHTYLLEHYECEMIGEIGACNGNIPIYCLEYKGENNVGKALIALEAATYLQINYCFVRRK